MILEVPASGGFNINKTGGAEGIASFETDGAVTLKHNNATRFATTAAGATFTSDNGSNTWIFDNDHSAPYGQVIRFTGASPNNNTAYFVAYSDATESKFLVYSDGDVQSRTNSYGGISDVKLKTDIEDARDYWSDWKDIRFRKFRFKSDVEQYGDDSDMFFGVVAQELETVFPGLIKDCPDQEHLEGEVKDLGTTTKGVKHSVLSQIGLKVLQEAQTRIEALEAQVAALQN